MNCEQEGSAVRDSVVSAGSNSGSPTSDVLFYAYLHTAEAGQNYSCEDQLHPNNKAYLYLFVEQMN